MPTEGKIPLDDRTNSIILTETQDRINQLRRLSRLYDTHRASDGWHPMGLTIGNNLETIGALRAGEVPADNLIVDLGTSSGRTGGIAFGTVDSDFLLDLELELYESEGTGETISRPTIITSDKSTASVNSGSQIPYQSDTGDANINATVGLTV